MTTPEAATTTEPPSPHRAVFLAITVVFIGLLAASYSLALLHTA